MKITRLMAGSWLVMLAVGAVVVDFFQREQALAQNIEMVLSPPSLQFWFGADSLGRDLFLRILLGAKNSLLVGFFASLLALGIGLVYGMVAGSSPRWLDRLLMRGTDIFLSIPSFIVVSVLTLLLEKLQISKITDLANLICLTVAIGLTHWLQVSRMTRNLVRQSKILPYVESARALGASGFSILKTHVLPNLRPHLVTMFGLLIPTSILYESFMSFLGLGFQSPETSWGLLMQEGWKSLTLAPHLMLFPAMVLFLTIWSVHIFLGDIKSSQTTASLFKDEALASHQIPSPEFQTHS